MPVGTKKQSKSKKFTVLNLTPNDILSDLRLGWVSRYISLIGRKEVLTGKAKFGIFGGGKELPQIVLSKFFQNGDFRSGYYRDQTILLALGLATPQQIFAQLYADPSLEHEPHSGGRQMNAHFHTPNVDKNGNWLNLMAQKNTSSGISSTSAQMPRAVGLALASKKYREISLLSEMDMFSDNGNEVTFATIGDASTSEGHFWESINACGVLKVPIVVNIWDDGYGISVPTSYQTTKGDISEVLSGFEIDSSGAGYYIHKCKGWQYEELIKTYHKTVPKVRKTHNPALLHITELTQPQGHSTSGSHERYKSKERLAWEKEYDCLLKFEEWILKQKIATREEIEEIKASAKKEVNEAKKEAWKAYRADIDQETKQLLDIYTQLNISELSEVQSTLEKALLPTRKDLLASVKTALFELRGQEITGKETLLNWKQEKSVEYQNIYSTHLYSETANNVFNVKQIEPAYSENSPNITGFQLLNKCFDAAFERDPKLLAFGEDLGVIGDVNQGFAGLQLKHGEERIFDTGIREATIMGQGIGLAMRGFRPIAEIQYLDYFIFGMQPISDDLATLQYRTVGGQIAPLIVRTRGHRLEGIWHSGSPIAMILHACRGVRFCVPRNMTQAAGFYNALLQSNEPAIIIECLNGYRLRERLPDNIGEFTTPFGIPEILKEGKDVTLVTYGSCIRVVEEVLPKLASVNIDLELIDIQTLQPFDIHHKIAESIKKTNRVIFMDEDVPGGATAFMMQQVLEVHGAYQWLDSMPKTISAQPHRTAYGSDGDYFTKPNPEDVFETVYNLMREAEPDRFPEIY